VLLGVIVSALRFAWQTGSRMHGHKYMEDEVRVYQLHGPLFLGSARAVHEQFDPKGYPALTIADFRYSKLHDHSALEAVSPIAEGYRMAGKTLTLRHLSPEPSYFEIGTGLCRCAAA
jgi:SulP family sulfate permease